ncbi:MAG TPA: PH domain-containing protein [Candidatus Avamphibacillus sp.]|nr:PH domain-containing protein [Candidatus Avamphibacillus sp.]
MTPTMNEPNKSISKDAIKVWRITNLIINIIMIIIGIGLIGASFYFDWYRWIQITLAVLLAIGFILSIWDIFIEPVLLQRYWRYDISSEYVQIKHGILNMKQTIMPMTKVQYVTAKQGPLLRKYQLYTLQIGTMSTSIDIPALPEQTALTLRSKIVEYAKIKEVEDL